MPILIMDVLLSTADASSKLHNTTSRVLSLGIYALLLSAAQFLEELL
jgi:hypothetical protein